jgi:hypothetical protein
MDRMVRLAHAAVALLLTTGALAVAGGACSFVLEDVQQPPTAGGGAAGSGAAGTGLGGNGTGATGTGGAAGATCTDAFDVAPMALGLSGASLVSYDEIALAARDQVFGLAWVRSSLDADGGDQHEVRFTTFTPDGALRPQASAGTFPPPMTGYALAASSSLGFAASALGRDALQRFDVDGAALGSAIALDPGPEHLLLTGSPNGILATAYHSGWSSQWLADSSQSATSPTAIPTTSAIPMCCVERRWAVVFDGQRFVAVWIATDGIHIGRISADGIPEAASAAVSTASTDYMPRPIIAQHGANVLAGSCSVVVEVTPQNAVTATLPLMAQGFDRCVAASDGTHARLAYGLSSGAIEWHAVDTPDGLGPPLLSLDAGMSAIGSFDVAWDGHGYGLVWLSQGAEDVMYAHITPCAGR